MTSIVLTPPPPPSPPCGRHRDKPLEISTLHRFSHDVTRTFSATASPPPPPCGRHRDKPRGAHLRLTRPRRIASCGDETKILALRASLFASLCSEYFPLTRGNYRKHHNSASSEHASLLPMLSNSLKSSRSIAKHSFNLINSLTHFFLHSFILALLIRSVSVCWA